MEITSPLTFEISGEPFLLEKRIRLLHAIEEHGSISKAAKAVPMSYKSAWEAVDAMNSLSPEPIVIRETGGKDGGGTTITEYGVMLLQNYALLREEHSRFLERLSELTDIENGAFGTIGRLGLQISARNQIQAAVLQVEPGEVNARVYLKLKGGQELLSIITEEAVENLHIEAGQIVTAICKSSNVNIVNNVKDTMKNRLEGKVVQIEKDKLNAKISVDIGGHDRIISVMPLEKAQNLVLTEGSAVIIGIEAKNIMLGR
ncbi:TOBE domain-containing protein [Sulfurovum riftiae]|uniref:Molybdenum-binding protein n=1 Tax=Sulfurovum riftiae TaxID=1630136 RepID=A0A151CF93_9BACT|nr:TOBE domain-containing protein [Sulfurovum riftiae]KYJ86191.1 molybdenum-binding protein [Sulfurovum riftiae]